MTAEGHDDKHHPPIQGVHRRPGSPCSFTANTSLHADGGRVLQFGEESIGNEDGIISNGRQKRAWNRTSDLVLRLLLVLAMESESFIVEVRCTPYNYT